MRVEEHKNIIPQKTVVSYTYYGNCPVCNKEQISCWKTNVDTICTDCRFKKESDERQEFLNNYVGATILHVQDTEVIVKLKNNKVYRIEVDVDYNEDEVKFDIYEIHEGNAEWFQ